MYPPLTLYLLVPFVVLPLVAWWLVPLVVIAWHVWTMRPAYWSAPLIAGCLVFLAPSAIIVYGNTDLWTAAVLCLGLRWPTSSWALAFKPSVLSLAILFARGRRWWVGAVVVIVLALPFGSMWLDYVEAMSNLEASPLRSSVLPLGSPSLNYLGGQDSAASNARCLTCAPSVGAYRLRRVRG